MTRLINIDNGGTLTDFCLVDGDEVRYTKALTTPYDLSRCLFDGLAKVSELAYGQPQPATLLQSTDTKRREFSGLMLPSALVTMGEESPDPRSPVAREPLSRRNRSGPSPAWPAPERVRPRRRQLVRRNAPMAAMESSCVVIV
jgi:Hydantoinase/oxoprolinase N-terminal region